ncbi:hypothetical protein BJ980_000967 [Nocardioides daedukensis]|uniref:Glycosyltransferase RgtA/B/C/D-like domain-containing protein n=1 Tax=Nocardioides daedukensis TaxID=634462 RepID=A0A7Y9S1J5_9ACTN|nr:hypothetical protein [Nocardioides daedukensis]NYG58044.1 hypothetical protein [Nocardioides daedukensis]
MTRLIRNVLPVCALLVLFGAAGRSAALRLTNDDTFFHLRFGAEFQAGWSIRDPGSVTEFGTRDWVPTQWAAQMTMAWLESWGGTAAVAWLSGLGMCTFVLVLYLACRRWATPLVATCVTAVAFIAASQGLSARPQVFSYILITVTVSAWLATSRDGRLRWWLIPLTWAWSSLHGMWTVGVVIGVVAALGIALDRREPGQLRALVVPIASAGSVLLTPVGPGLLREIATIGSRSEYFAEWGPTHFTDLQPLVLSALLALVLLIWFRHGETSWLHGLLLLLAGAWCLYSMRTVPVAAALVAPIAAASIMRIVPAQESARTADKRWAWAGWVVTLVVLALVTPHTLKVGPDLPSWSEDELTSLPDGAVVLNDWEWGGYLMWEHPDLDFVLSGYGDIYTTEELDRNIDLVRVNPEWDDAVESIEPDLAILRTDSPLAYALEQRDDWSVVRSEDGVTVLRPSD